MNLGALLVLVKFLQDAEIAKPTKLTYAEKVGRLYTEEKALGRAEAGLGL